MVCLIPFQGDSSMVFNTSSGGNRRMNLVLQLRAAQQQYRVYLQDKLAIHQPIDVQTDTKLAQLRDEVLRLTNLAYPDM